MDQLVYFLIPVPPGIEAQLVYFYLKTVSRYPPLPSWPLTYCSNTRSYARWSSGKEYNVG